MTSSIIDDIRESGSLQSQTVALPTGGRFYDTSVLAPDADPGDIEVRPLGIMDENTINDPLLLATGKAISRMVSHVCPEVQKPGALAEIDVEAILLACRLISHGPELTVTHVCENPDTTTDKKGNTVSVCGQENQHKLDLQDFMFSRYGPMEDFSLFETELDFSGGDREFTQTVYFRPISYDAVINIMMSTMKTSRKMESLSGGSESDDEWVMNEKVIDSYLSVIEEANAASVDALVESIQSVVSSNGNEERDPDVIHEWLLMMPTSKVKQIREQIRKISEYLKSVAEIKYDCPHCGYGNTMYMQMDPQKLFTVAEDSAPETKSSAKSKTTRKKKTKSARIS